MAFASKDQLEIGIELLLCLEGKLIKREFNAKSNRATKFLKLVYYDACRLMDTQAKDGYEYNLYL